MKAKGEHKIFRVIFAKKGQMKYISHLDLVRLFHRAARRAEIPFVLSQGFSPRPKISFKRALKLGVESESEEATFQVKATISAEDFTGRLQGELPEGIIVKEVEDIT